MLALALSAALAFGAPQGVAACENGDATIGQADTPLELRFEIDPLDANALVTWLESRVLVGERPEDLRVRFVLRSPAGLGDNPDEDRVRAFVLFAARHGQIEAALRVVRRRGRHDVLAQLSSERGRERLLATVGLEGVGMDLSSACLRDALRMPPAVSGLSRSELRLPRARLYTAEGPGVLIDPRPRLPDARDKIEVALQDLRRSRPSNALELDSRVTPRLDEAAAALDRTVEGIGIVVGGSGLPHSLLVFADDEDAATLPKILEPAVHFRRERPGSVAVQVVATGVGLRANEFRRRLCAARLLGLEAEYLALLAEPTDARAGRSRGLREILDETGSGARCEDAEPLEAFGGLSQRDRPHGAWLDGRPVTAADLGALYLRVAVPAREGPLPWLWPRPSG